MTFLEKIERGCWKDLEWKLCEIRAVTEKDCRAGPDDSSTPGRLILCLVRNWGEALVNVRGAR